MLEKVSFGSWLTRESYLEKTVKTRLNREINLQLCDSFVSWEEFSTRPYGSWSWEIKIFAANEHEKKVVLKNQGSGKYWGDGWQIWDLVLNALRFV